MSEYRAMGGDVIHVDRFSSDICEVLGLDPNVTGSVNIEVRPLETRVTVVRYLTGEDAEHVKRLVEKYELVRKDEA